MAKRVVVLSLLVALGLLPLALPARAGEEPMTPERVADWFLWGNADMKAQASGWIEGANASFLAAFQQALADRRQDPDAAADRLIERALASPAAREEAERLLLGLGPVAVRRLVDRLAGTDSHLVDFGTPRIGLPEPPVIADGPQILLALAFWKLGPGAKAALPPAASGPAGGMTIAWLDEPEAQALGMKLQQQQQGAETLACPSVVVSDREQASIRIDAPVAYVKEFRVERHADSTIADPVIATIDAGHEIDLTPTLSADGKTVTVEASFRLQDVRRPIPTKTVRLEGLMVPVEIQMPELVETNASTTVRVPDGGTVLLRGLATPGSPDHETIALLDVRRVSEPDAFLARAEIEAAAEDPFLNIESWVLEADPAVVRRALGGRLPGGDGGAVTLDAAQVLALLGKDRSGGEGLTVISAPRLTTYNGQRANISVLNQVSYVSDFEVERGNATTVANPIIQTIQEGLILEVTPRLSDDGTGIDLETEVTLADIQRPIPEFKTTLEGTQEPVTIQLPELTVLRIKEKAHVAPGGYVLLGTLGDTAKAVRLVVLRATVIGR